jgi:sugar (pentulose or hexulose) kinase
MWGNDLRDGAYIVADLGKTLAKLTLWSKDGRLLERVTRPNQRQDRGGLAVLDVDGICQWLETALASFASHPVEAIMPVSHGAAVAGLHNATPAFAPLDYENPIPEQQLHRYRARRDPFAITGSPALPDGLNIGCQLHLLDSQDPQGFPGVQLLPYAQYWAWWLSGVAVSERSSLGCHSDLWAPAADDFSPMAKRRGWAAQFAPMARAGDVIGTLRPALAARTGLPPTLRVHAGLHDSNAALLAARGFPEIAENEATVLSTGTWFIALRLARSAVDLPALPEARDCLVNVDPFGQAVPSARYMGGREIESLIELDTHHVDIKPDQPALLAAVADVLAVQAMVLPAFAPGTGPFPCHKGRWINRPECSFARRAAACLYAALMTEVSLSLIGSRRALLVEGRFAEAEVYVRALASLRPDMTVYTANAHNDVSFGALRLIDPALRPPGQLQRVLPLEMDLSGYAARWRSLLS